MKFGSDVALGGDGLAFESDRRAGKDLLVALGGVVFVGAGDVIDV